jgi:hypothetical protein
MANYANLRQIIWANRLQVALQKSLVYTDVSNTTYQGEARIGGTVKISQIGEVAVEDYVAGTDMTFETLDDASLSMVIDQQKNFAFTLDDTDTVFVQNNLIGAGIDRGTYRIADRIDTFLSGKYTDAGIAYGSAASPKATSSGTVYQHLLEFSETLDEASVPKADRWIIVPPWIMTKLGLAGIASTLNPNRDIFRDGYVGPVAGFGRVYVSNNVTQIGGTAHTIMASSGRDAIAFATAISGPIRIREAEKRRATNVDGLVVYGGKVVRPDMLGVLYSNETAN